MKYKLILFIDGFISILLTLQVWIELLTDKESWASVHLYYFWKYLGEQQ